MKCLFYPYKKYVLTRMFGLQIDKKKGATRFCSRIAPFIRLANYLDNLFYELNSCLMSRSQELRLID